MPRYTSEVRLRQIAEQNARFLMHLRRTGNATMAADMAGRHVATFRGRRRADAEFDQQWTSAVVFARGALWSKGGAAPASGYRAKKREAAGGGASAEDAVARGMIAGGGEYMVGANLNNGLQVRRARRGHVTARGEAKFLEALAATANIRLAAEAVGVDSRAFYKRRAQSQDFARRMQEALASGYEAVEFALVKTALRTLAPEGAEAGEADGMDAEGPEPRMSVEQAMTLIAQRAKTMAIGERHAQGKFHSLPSPEESDAALLKRLEMLARKKRERGLLSDGRE